MAVFFLTRMSDPEYINAKQDSRFARLAKYPSSAEGGKNMEFTLFMLRWLHFLAGITWIGILYYFNFVQTPFFAETEATIRTGAIQKLVPRALWWFRWGAMVTFLAGLLMYLSRWHQMGGDAFVSSQY